MKSARKLCALFLAACLSWNLAACGSGGEAAAEDSAPPEAASDPAAPEVPMSDEPSQGDAGTPASEPQDGESGILVAYFSATGNTKAVAEQIAAVTGGDLYEIVPAQPYTDADLDYGNSESRSSLEMDDPHARPEIGSEAVDLTGYSTLYLGYPIWHGQAPRILNTFVEQHDFDTLTIIPFCTSGSSGIGSSAQGLAELAGSGDWLEGTRFSAGVSAADLQLWIEDLQQ